MAVSQLGTPTGNTGNTASVSVSHTVAAGSNVVTYIFVWSANETTHSSISFAGQTPTRINTDPAGMYVYRVISPSAGATSFTCTLSQAAAWSAVVVSYQGVDTADPDDTPLTHEIHSDPVAPITVTVTTATGDRAVAFAFIVADQISAATDSTLIIGHAGIDGGFVSTAVVYRDSNGSVPVGATSTSFCCDSYIVGFNINAAGAGAAYTITCDQGSYSLTGRDAGLVKQTPQMAAEQGTYTLIGSDAYREIQVNMEQGSYALSGQDAGLTIPVNNLVIVCETGTYTYTGAEAYRDIYQNMEAGSYNLTGQDVALSRNFILALDAGSYGLEGFPAGLIWDGQPDAPPARPIMRRRFFGSRLGR
jgi:hypothetical protein